MRLATTTIALLSIFIVSPADGEPTKHSFLRHLEADNCGRSDDCPEEVCVGDLPDRCLPDGGSCSGAVLAFLGQNITGAVDLLKYGKYCGRLNRCSKLEGCEAKDLPKPCNAIDEACKIHDACLDDAIKDHEDETGKCFDDATNNIDAYPRLECDASYVATLAGILSDESDNLPGTADSGLCDLDYYTSDPVAQVAQVLEHEAVLMAAPFCLAIVRSGYCPVTGKDRIGACKVAWPFCEGVADKLALLGL